jgi:predicted ABC-type ATPase
MNRLDLVAGPDGAGKSTFVELTLAPLLPGSVFVNTDEIARQRWPNDPASHAYDAALLAAETRLKLVELGLSFIAETVFSHPSKLELIDAAQAAGFTVVLHVVLIPEELAVARVAYRMQSGGHPLAENKIRERYHRLWTQVADAITRCEQATVYDNSGLQGPRIVAQMSEGFIVGSPAWPDWTPPALKSHWPSPNRTGG